ncbi:MAG: hypothetical protein OXC91_03305 [Rhodobacteraceae bacterium]|nr:hypothetical protein [Paracoccaceae bacterium]
MTELVVNPQTAEIVGTRAEQPPSLVELSEHTNALAEYAKAALARDGAVVTIGKGRHVTLKPLSEIAALMQVSVTCEHLEPTTDPLSQAPMARAVCVVTRSDGVSVRSAGVCSAGETTFGRDGSTRARWTEWHAMQSMAETRAKVRALHQLLAPVLTIADNDLSSSPYEIMPADANGGQAKQTKQAKQANGRRTTTRSYQVTERQAAALEKASNGAYSRADARKMTTAQCLGLTAQYEQEAEGAAKVEEKENSETIAVVEHDTGQYEADEEPF